INEMLLQSWGNTIRVFPAVPDTWKEASFHDLLTKGAFLVSAVRKNGLTQFIRIKSLAGQPCLVKTGWTGDVKATGKRKFTVTKINDDKVLVDLKKDEEVILFTGAKPSSIEITEAASD